MWQLPAPNAEWAGALLAHGHAPSAVGRFLWRSGAADSIQMPRQGACEMLTQGTHPAPEMAVMVLGPPALRHLDVEACPVVAVWFSEALIAPANTLIVNVGQYTEFLPYRAFCPCDDEPGKRSAKLHELVNGSAGPGGGQTAPLFCLVGDERRGWRPYTQIAVSGRDLMFIALGGDPLTGDLCDPEVVMSQVAELGRRHRAHGPQLNNHQRWFVNCREGLEIEHKFTLDGEPNIWRLALTFRAIVAQGGLLGWMPEFGNDFEQWDFNNRVFEVREPADERGHIAFIPAVDGRWIIRRKWDGDDPTVRRENLTEGVVLPADPDLAGVIRERFKVEPVETGTYRRLRYNVMLESPNTGHIFSVMFDRCTSSQPVPDLYQVEVEYIRSRTLGGRHQDDGLTDDFRYLCDWTRSVLAAHNVTASEDHLSKLSWLRARDAGRRGKIP